MSSPWGFCLLFVLLLLLLFFFVLVRFVGSFCPRASIRASSSVQWCPLLFARKNDVHFSFIPICYVWSSCFMTRFLYQMMFEWSNSTSMSASGGSGPATNSERTSSLPMFSQVLVGFIVFFFFWTLHIAVLLRLMTSGYHFKIFNFFY